MGDANPTTEAWTYNHEGYPSSLRLTKLSIPKIPPSPHHIILRTSAAALNPVDIQLMNLPVWSLPLPLGHITTVRKGQMGLGEDFAGTVLAAGSAVKDVAPGDQVFGLSMTIAGSTGTLQQIAVIDTSKAAVVKKPAHWSWAQAAALSLVWLTARTIIDAVEPAVTKGAGKKLVVLGGSSATGMYVVKQAQARGWNVLATCSERNADFVKSMGAQSIVDYTAQSVPNEVEKFAPDAIVDCVGGTECLALSKRYVTIVGDKTSRASMGGNLIYLWNPQMVLRWALGRIGLGVHYDCVNLQVRNDWLAETLTLEDKDIVVDSEFAMDKANEAFERLNTGRCRGKVVVNVAE